MRNFIFLLIAFLLAIPVSGEEKNVKLSFVKDQFSFANDENGALLISTNEHAVVYGQDLDAPRLPFISVNVLIPNNYVFNDVAISTEETLLYNNVEIAPIPECVPTGYDGERLLKPAPNNKNIVYPSTNVVYATTSVMDGYTILRFLVCPFKYDAPNKRLYMAESAVLSITTSPSNSVITIDSSSFNKGVYTVSLIVDGKVADSRNIVKKIKLLI